MTTNRATLDWLFATKQIRLHRGPLFDAPPPPTRAIAWDKVEGMLLGLTIGDARRLWWDR